ncbi:hypothetical protein VZC37_13180 [Gordonia sp. LSe1-13]|uniref:Uncharacterized protein n=1 Tax=Gordonia sesuvii TaxID=3116777 RepID=A0ABU7MDV3_9ACTN|nr:hypothetical protein [Gordonia sp. LSe1-13]
MGWIIAAIIITVWVTVSVVLALVIARAVRLRDIHEKPQPVHDDFGPPGSHRDA